MRSLRVSRYLGLSNLHKLLVLLRVKRWTDNASDWDQFHKRMGTPENEN